MWGSRLPQGRPPRLLWFLWSSAQESSTEKGSQGSPEKEQNPRQQRSLVKPEFLQHPSLSLSLWLQKQHTPPLAENARPPGAGRGPCRGRGVHRGLPRRLPRGGAGAVETETARPGSGPQMPGNRGNPWELFQEPLAVRLGSEKIITGEEMFLLELKCGSRRQIRSLERGWVIDLDRRSSLDNRVPLGVFSSPCPAVSSVPLAPLPYNEFVGLGARVQLWRGR